MALIFEDNYDGYFVQIWNEYEHQPELPQYNIRFLRNPKDRDNDCIEISLYALDKVFSTIVEGEKYQIHEQQNMFTSNDYYQERIEAYPYNHGLGSKFHEYLINNYHKFPFKLESIYSSIKGTITEAGIAFWESQVRKGKAQFIPEANRYKLFLG